MKHNTNFFNGMLLFTDSDEKRWGLLQGLYEKNYIKNSTSNNIRIPRIIHQIWLGGTVPEKYDLLRATWKKYHPDWQYYLWTDESVKNIKLINQEAFDKTENVGAKSDILRYEILYTYGGVYVDIDFECLKPFNEIHSLCTFYAGLLSDSIPKILIGIIGSEPKNEVIKRNIEKISIASRKRTPDDVFSATGPIHFTQCFFDVVSDVDKDYIVFPPSFFYPSPNVNSGIGRDAQRRYIREESYAIHYWDLSWTRAKGSMLRLIRKIVKNILPYGFVKSYILRNNK